VNHLSSICEKILDYALESDLAAVAMAIKTHFFEDGGKTVKRNTEMTFITASCSLFGLLSLYTANQWHGARY